MAATSAPFVEKASAGMRDLWASLASSEARFFDEERYSEAEIRRLLSDSLTDRKIDGMKRILAAVSNGNDVSGLFPEVVKNVSFQSLELKKLIYIYLVQYSEKNRGLALLSINSFQKDLSDRSQLVRASALRAMASIQVIEVIQLVMVAVKTASNDSSAYVRKTAAQCMTKVYAVDPDQFFELRALLLKLMRDHEVQVVGSAVMAFHHLCIVRPPKSSPEAGEETGASLEPEAMVRLQLELLHPHFRRLCQDILLMDPWAQQCCVDLLVRYTRLFFVCPHAKEGEGSPSEDFNAVLKALRLLLCSASRGVTLAAVVALCYLSPPEELDMITMPLLRCLRQAPAESAHVLLGSMARIAEARPNLLRASVREFFVQSFDFPGVKDLKLRILEGLVDETNVQTVLRELQAYVCWQSHPEFVARAVKSIAHVALKIPTVTDSCLRGLVKMLDSKCEALACEAVVALRALLQRRRQTSDSGLGAVLPHLARYLEDLAAPTARASVVWIIGQYQREAPKLAPDVLRRLAKCFAAERQEVKQQVLMLSVKVWAFHALNALSMLPDGEEGKGQLLTAEESAKVLPRLEAVVDHVMKLASLDIEWDVRDTARVLRGLKAAAKARIEKGEEAGSALEELGMWYCRASVTGESPGEEAGDKDGTEEAAKLEDGWKLDSMAMALDFPLDTYRALPQWAKEGTADEIRAGAKTPAPNVSTAPKSISSANVGNVQHMEQRVQNPSNITNMPVVSTLEDLDLFYSQDLSKSAPSAAKAPAGRGSAASEPGPTPEQVRIAAPVVPVGTAVFGEDDESEEEEEEEDDDGDDWKYCAQAASAPSQPPASAAPPPADVPPAAAAAEPAVSAAPEVLPETPATPAVPAAADPVEAVQASELAEPPPAVEAAEPVDPSPAPEASEPPAAAAPQAEPAAVAEPAEPAAAAEPAEEAAPPAEAAEQG